MLKLPLVVLSNVLFIVDQACESMDSIPVEENITHSAMSELYLKGLSPVIVTDAMKDWPERKDINIGYLTEVRIIAGINS